MVTSDDNFNAVISVLEHLKGKDTIKALSLSDAGIVHGFRDKFELIESYGIDMIFCNDDEAIAFSNKENLSEAEEFYKSKSYMTVITKGSEGSIVVENGITHIAEAEKITPIDTNGAGDMFAGSFMHAYVERIKKELDTKVLLSDDLHLDAQSIESMAFAWMGYKRMNEQTLKVQLGNSKYISGLLGSIVKSKQ